MVPGVSKDRCGRTMPVTLPSGLALVDPISHVNHMLRPWVTVSWGITPSSQPIMGSRSVVCQGPNPAWSGRRTVPRGRRSFRLDICGPWWAGLARCAPTGRRSAVRREGKTPSQSHRSTTGQRVGYIRTSSLGAEPRTAARRCRSGHAVHRYQLRQKHHSTPGQAGSM